MLPAIKTVSNKTLHEEYGNETLRLIVLSYELGLYDKKNQWRLGNIMKNWTYSYGEERKGLDGSYLLPA